MNSKIWLINLALLGIVSFFGVKTYGVWFHAGDIPEKKTLFKSAVRNKKHPVTVARKHMPPEHAYDVVVQRDLFDKERKYEEEVIGKKEAEVKEAPAISINVFLYGVVLTDSSRRALMTNPDRKTRKKKMVWVKEGDTLGDFHVSRIERERVLLKKGGKTYNISLYDKKKPRSRIPAQVKQVKKPHVTTVKSAAPKTPPSVPKQRPAPKRGNKKIIKTPFGTIKREKK